MIDAALEAGVTFLDTADVYGSGDSERFIGAALGDRRDRVVLASKFGQDASVPGPGGSREHLRHAIDASLERLAADVIDLYYYHRPDGVTPLAETLGAMQELVEEGRVRWLGLSNVDADLIREAAATGIPVVAVQNHYSLLRREDDADVLPLCRELEIGYVPYFPLESGLLTGKYRRGEPAPPGARLSGADDGRLSDERFDAVEALEDVACRARATRCSSSPSVGSRRSPGSPPSSPARRAPEQVSANAAAGAWHAPGEVLDALARVGV